jgi:hypothetical protein
MSIPEHLVLIACLNIFACDLNAGYMLSPTQNFLVLVPLAMLLGMCASLGVHGFLHAHKEGFSSH